MDYRERFGIAPAPVEEPKDQQRPSGRYCECCEEPLSNAEAFFCRINKTRFAGQMLCRKCQAYAPAEKQETAQKPSPQPASTGPSPASQCAECGVGVDAKVVAFCRFNSKRFGKRVLCRSCQARAR